MNLSAKILLCAGLGLALATVAHIPVAQAGVHVGIRVGVAPPAPLLEPIPGLRVGFVWAPGYWRWGGHRYVWVGGHWLRHRRGYRYLAPRWIRHGNSWRFQRGHWRPSHHRRPAQRWRRNRHQRRFPRHHRWLQLRRHQHQTRHNRHNQRHWRAGQRRH